MFSFFFNDLKSFVSTENYGIDLYLCKLFLLLFADDLVIFAETKIELQMLLNKLYAYCTEWNLKVNIDKTTSLFFEMDDILEGVKNGFKVIFS